MMRQEKDLRRLRRRLVILAAAGAVVVVILAVLIKVAPSGYRPVRLDYEQRQTAAKQFYRKMMDFDDLAQSNAPFEFTFTAEQINRYLASMDEIAAMLPGGDGGRVRELMDEAGLSDPAVAMGEGTMTLMVRSSRGGLVVSAELSPAMDERGRLTVPLGPVQVGRLPLSRGMVRGYLEQTRETLWASYSAQGSDKDVPGGEEVANLPAVAAHYAMRMVLAALDGQPIMPEGKYRRHRIRLAAIEITPGQLTVHVAPVPRQPPQSAVSRMSVQSSPSSRLSR